MREFKPFVMYNEHGDMLEILWSPEAHYADWKNHRLTLLRSHKDKNKIVGITITGFRRCFMHCGFCLDPKYDEAPPLTPEEQAEVDAMIKKAFPQVGKK